QHPAIFKSQRFQLSVITRDSERHKAATQQLCDHKTPCVSGGAEHCDGPLSSLYFSLSDLHFTPLVRTSLAAPPTFRFQNRARLSAVGIGHLRIFSRERSCWRYVRS